MGDWSIDTWLLTGVVLTGILSTGLAAFAIYRTMRRARRDRMWRRIDVLADPLDNWARGIYVKEPTWILNRYEGDMSLIPTSVHDLAIEKTLPAELVNRVREFYESRSSYASASTALRNSIEKDSKKRFNLEIENPEEPSAGSWITPHFIDSLYGGLYVQSSLAALGKIEYQEANRYGSDSGPRNFIVSIHLRWINGPISGGVWQAAIVENFDPNRGDADVRVPDLLHQIADYHQNLLTDYDDHGVKDDMSELISLHGQLSEEARQIHAEIADFRAH